MSTSLNSLLLVMIGTIKQHVANMCFSRLQFAKTPPVILYLIQTIVCIGYLTVSCVDLSVLVLYNTCVFCFHVVSVIRMCNVIFTYLGI